MTGRKRPADPRHIHALLGMTGVDPEKDVSWIAVEEGVPTAVVLEHGDIDALAYCGVGFGQIEEVAPCSR